MLSEFEKAKITSRSIVIVIIDGCMSDADAEKFRTILAHALTNWNWSSRYDLAIALSDKMHHDVSSRRDGLPVRQHSTRWNVLFSPASPKGHGRSTIYVEKRYGNVIYYVKES